MVGLSGTEAAASISSSSSPPSKTHHFSGHHNIISRPPLFDQSVTSSVTVKGVSSFRNPLRLPIGGPPRQQNTGDGTISNGSICTAPQVSPQVLGSGGVSGYTLRIADISSTRNSGANPPKPIRTTTAVTVGSSTFFATRRPDLGVNIDSGSQVTCASGTPNQLRGQYSSPAAKAPILGTLDKSNYFKNRADTKTSPYRISAVPVLPDLKLSRPESDGFLKIPGLTSISTLSSTNHKDVELNQGRAGNYTLANSELPTAREERRPEEVRTKENRSHSQKAMLASALQKANTAVTLDNAENYEGAMEAYGDACILLNQVMIRAGADEDKRKLQTIKETYMQRIEELKELPPRISENERELPPPPEDGSSMYTVEDDESTSVASAAPSIGNVPNDTTTMRPEPVPPRRDSIFISAEGILGMESRLNKSLSRSNSSESIIPPPLSPRPPIRPPVSPARELSGLGPEGVFHKELNQNRESFTFGAAALSPRFSPRKANEYGLRRSSSNGSDSSSVFLKLHSRQGSEEGTTSWLNTIDESGSSNGEPSPGWTRKKQSTLESEQAALEKLLIPEAHFGDFDTQLDAAVEAAYDEGYEVDYPYDREEEMLMIKSPRLNVERAKERVREVEREMELAVQKEKERRMERERMGYFSPKPESDMDFFDDLEDDESEEERMLEEMTRGYTLDDFDFNLGTKTALPRESGSTQYTDSTYARGSTSSGYSSGTTWGSGHMTTNTSLTTVTEAPTTPPPIPLPPPPIERDTVAGKENKVEAEKERVIAQFKSHPPPPQSPPPPLPTGLPVSKTSGVRSRRLSALSEALEPLKIESPPSSSLSTDVPTIAPGPSPQGETEPPPAPIKEPPPVPSIPPLSIPLKSPRNIHGLASSRPDISNELRDFPILESPERKDLPPADTPTLSSPTPPLLGVPNGGYSAVPLAKTTSDDGMSGSRAESPAKFTHRVPGIPPLRQIHSSASLRSRNFGGSESEPPGTPVANLFASSSMSNLRKAFPRGGAPNAIPMTPMRPPPTAGLPSGMNLFDTQIPSPNSADLVGGVVMSSNVPARLEPCPPEPLSKPFWLMRSLYQTIAHARGGYISTKLFVPREVWYIKGVKLRAVDDKINACDIVTAALLKLATVKQDEVNSVFEEMQALEGVLDRAQQTLSKKLGNEVGPVGAKSLYGDQPPSEALGNDMVTTKIGNIGGGTKSYFSLRKLRTKASNQALSSNFNSSAVGSGHLNGESFSSLPIARKSTEGPEQQAKRNVDSVQFGGPHAHYISALAKLFDSAQILDHLTVFDDNTMSEKVPITLRIGLELSHRHAAEFFGLYICRFVLADISQLLDKFVKRGSEWVAQ